MILICTGSCWVESRAPIETLELPFSFQTASVPCGDGKEMYFWRISRWVMDPSTLRFLDYTICLLWEIIRWLMFWILLGVLLPHLTSVICSPIEKWQPSLLSYLWWRNLSLDQREGIFIFGVPTPRRVFPVVCSFGACWILSRSGFLFFCSRGRSESSKKGSFLCLAGHPHNN